MLNTSEIDIVFLIYIDVVIFKFISDDKYSIFNFFFIYLITIKIAINDIVIINNVYEIKIITFVFYIYEYFVICTLIKCCYCI